MQKVHNFFVFFCFSLITPSTVIFYQSLKEKLFCIFQSLCPIIKLVPPKVCPNPGYAISNALIHR